MCLECSFGGERSGTVTLWPNGIVGTDTNQKVGSREDLQPASDACQARIRPIISSGCSTRTSISPW